MNKTNEKQKCSLPYPRDEDPFFYKPPLCQGRPGPASSIGMEGESRDAENTQSLFDSSNNLISPLTSKTQSTLLFNLINE